MEKSANLLYEQQQCVLILSWAVFYVLTATNNPTIYNITHWFAGLLVCWDKWLVDQASDVQSNSVSIISHRLKTLYSYFCKLIKKKWKLFLQRILQEIMKKIILGTSDAWLTSEPAYYILDCRISKKWPYRLIYILWMYSSLSNV